MASAGDLTVTLRAKDELSPVIRRLTWQLWLFQHREGFVAAIWTLIVFVFGAIFGRVA